MEPTGPVEDDPNVTDTLLGEGYGLNAQAVGRLPGVLLDGRVCLTNNAAESALRGVALGGTAWLFAGSDRGGQHATAIYTFIATAKLNDLNPQAWLTDALAYIADTPTSRLKDLLPWN